MRLIIPIALILVFILAPVFLLPWILPSDSQEDLLRTAAREITARMPALPSVNSIAVETSGDPREALQHALTEALHQTPIRVITTPTEGDNKSQPQADATLAVRVQRNEIRGNEHHLSINATLHSNHAGELLWTTTWRDAAPLKGHDRDLFRSSLIISLALAAGTLVLLARRENHGLGTPTSLSQELACR